MVDWKPGDMWTYADWRDKILLEMQAAGINPFIERDASTLPSEGSNFSDLTNRVDKFYGNVVDGINIPGMHTKSDGTLTYQAEHDQGDMDTLNGYVEFLRWKGRADVGTPGFDEGLKNERFDVDTGIITLAGGAAANQEIVAASASKKCQVYWIIWSWDTDPAAAYTFSYHEQDSATELWAANMVPAARGRDKQHVYITQSTNNKAAQVDIGGGAGAEKLYFIVCSCYFS